MEALREKLKKYYNWKIIQCVLVIFFLFLLSQTDAVKSTGAVSYDQEKSSKNNFVAGEINLSLNSEADFSPQILPDQSAKREIKVKNEDGSVLDYELEIISVTGDLCSNLKLKADWKGDGTEEYDGNLADFILAIENLHSEDLWKLEANLVSDDVKWAGQSCEFDIQARAQQRYGLGQGFSDYEIIHNIIEAGIWTEPLVGAAPLAGIAVGLPADGTIQLPLDNLGLGDTSPENIPTEPAVVNKDPETGSGDIQPVAE